MSFTSTAGNLDPSTSRFLALEDADPIAPFAGDNEPSEVLSELSPRPSTEYSSVLSRPSSLHQVYLSSRPPSVNSLRSLSNASLHRAPGVRSEGTIGNSCFSLANTQYHSSITDLQATLRRVKRTKESGTVSVATGQQAQNATKNIRFPDFGMLRKPRRSGPQQEVVTDAKRPTIPKQRSVASIFGFGKHSTNSFRLTCQSLPIGVETNTNPLDDPKMAGVPAMDAIKRHSVSAHPSQAAAIHIHSPSPTQPAMNFRSTGPGIQSLAQVYEGVDQVSSRHEHRRSNSARYNSALLTISTLPASSDTTPCVPMPKRSEPPLPRDHARQHRSACGPLRQKQSMNASSEALPLAPQLPQYEVGSSWSVSRLKTQTPALTVQTSVGSLSTAPSELTLVSPGPLLGITFASNEARTALSSPREPMTANTFGSTQRDHRQDERAMEGRRSSQQLDLPFRDIHGWQSCSTLLSVENPSAWASKSGA